MKKKIFPKPVSMQQHILCIHQILHSSWTEQNNNHHLATNYSRKSTGRKAI